MWESVDDDWFVDGPLILEFDEIRLEVAAFKVHLCISWNSIDVARDIEWVPGSTFQLSWREGALAALEPLRGRPVDELSLLAYRGGLSGLAFRAGDAYAEIFNALDELGLRDTVAEDPEIVRTSLGDGRARVAGGARRSRSKWLRLAHRVANRGRGEGRGDGAQERERP